MATTAEPRRRLRRGAVAVLALAAVAWGAATALRDDDRSVDPRTPEARRAIEVARGVVPGRLLGVARDRDNGKWEVTVVQDGREYEVELDARDLSLLRLDYE